MEKYHNFFVKKCDLEAAKNAASKHRAVLKAHLFCVAFIILLQTAMFCFNIVSISE